MLSSLPKVPEQSSDFSWARGTILPIIPNSDGAGTPTPPSVRTSCLGDVHPISGCQVKWTEFWTTKRTANSCRKHELETKEARDRNWLLVMESGPRSWVQRPPVSVASFPGFCSSNHATFWAISVTVPFGFLHYRRGFRYSHGLSFPLRPLVMAAVAAFSSFRYDPCTMVRAYVVSALLCNYKTERYGLSSPHNRLLR